MITIKRVDKSYNEVQLLWTLELKIICEEEKNAISKS